MEPDYPAAHSMDTDWFAVDKDGHVAVFASGEAGAVPVAAGRRVDAHSFELFAVAYVATADLLAHLGIDPASIDPATDVLTSNRMVDALAALRGHDPDSPPHLAKVTETL